MAEIIIADAIGIYDGFVYVTASLSTDGTFTLMHVDTRDGLDTGSIVWIGAPGARQRLVWAGDTRAAAPSDTPFMAWGQIGAAQQTGISPLELPTAPAANNAGLLAGGTATINTTEGDQLNVRSGPGIDFGVVGRLADGTRVTLVEGPRAADGLRWWRIRVGDIEGWVVESVEDGGALIQTLIAGG
ncbi:MAG: SH3 domain-containing protein [Chloroflexi bacterium]|nr:SH3 domain-containing protein [Chloroflexota bacterium]